METAFAVPESPFALVADAEPDGDVPPGAAPPPEATAAPGAPIGREVELLHWSEFEVKVRARVRASDFPDAARQLEGGPWSCVVRVTVEADGTPSDVAFPECPEVFRENARAVAMRYRFYPLDPPRRAAFDLRVRFLEEEPDEDWEDWSSLAFGVAGGIAPLSSVAEPWSTSSMEVAATLDGQSEVVGVGVAAGVRGTGALGAAHLTLRFAPAPVAPTVGLRAGLVTGSPEAGAYLFLGLPLGVDLLPPGRFRMAVGAVPELDLSFTDGFSWRVGTFASVQLFTVPHPPRR